MANYEITMTDEQLKVVKRVLDSVSRMKCGQMQSLLDLLGLPHTSLNLGVIDTIKSITFPELTISNNYGILHEGAPYDAKMLYDIERVIARQLWEDETDHNEMSVDGENPLHVCESMPLITIRKV